MTFTTPPYNGVYRIRLYSSSSGNSYWEYMPGENSGIELKALDTYNKLQMFSIQSSGGSWTITCLSDNSSLTMYKTANTYWGHGYILGGSASNWTFQDKGSYSKIYCVGNSEPLDSYYGQYVHFYGDSNSQPNQKWVLELVPSNIYGGGQGNPNNNQGNPNNNQGNPNNNQGNPNNNQPSSGGISTDPNLSVTDSDGNVLSQANGNLNPDTIYVLNNTNGPIKVTVANSSNAYAPGELNYVILQPGEHQFWSRSNGYIETLAVYRADSSGNYPSSPDNYSASPGQITAVVAP